jgi:hypothetical protein
MKLIDSRLSADERAVWVAAYAASFVDQFRETKNACACMFDDAIEGHAETAITMADQAVEQLRRWRKDEGFSE